MRTFELVREVDVSGISGTGVVAEGVEFSDRTVVVRWLNAHLAKEHKARGVRPTTVFHEDLQSVLALHGHNGSSWVRFADGSVVGTDGRPSHRRRQGI